MIQNSDANWTYHPPPVHDEEGTEESGSPPTLRTSLMSNLIMIMRHQLHLHESRGMITPLMTHQPGATTVVRIDLHLGQKPKLGGRYADDSCFAFFIVLVLISAFQNTKRPKIFSLLLSICFFSFLPSVCFTCYFRLGI
jgi:hypothetical protein